MADKEMMEQFQLVLMAIGDVESRLTEKINAVENRMATKDDLRALEGRMEGRMDSLEGRMGSLEGRMDSLESSIKTLEGSAISKMLTPADFEMITDRSANKALAVVENTVGKRIDSLFDGYKLNQEKQGELVQRVETLEEIVLA